MKELTDEEKAEVTKVLKKKFKKYSEKSIKAQIDTLNHLRNGTMKVTDDLIPGICSYLDWILDTGLYKYIEPN